MTVDEVKSLLRIYYDIPQMIAEEWAAIRHCEEGKNRITLPPTQKPVAMFEYMIRTYKNPGELVLDSCMGSGTTEVACVQSGRNYTGFETDPTYYWTAAGRISKAIRKRTA